MYNLLKSPTYHIALQISHGQQTIFYEIYKKFAHAPSKRFTSPGVHYAVQDITPLNSQTKKLNFTAHTQCIILKSNKVHLLLYLLERRQEQYSVVDVQI
jgi:hypothetical protein